MDFKKHLEAAWNSSLQFIVPAILITLVQLVLITVSFGILAPVTTAGYMHSFLRAIREGREPKIGDLFSQMRLFLPLFVFGLIAITVTSIGFVLLVLPGFLVAAFILFATLYMIPLMLDKNLGLLDAIRESWQMAIRAPLSNQCIVVILYMVIIALGGSVAVAVLFTQPFSTFFILFVYEERLKEEQERIPPQTPPSIEQEDSAV